MTDPRRAGLLLVFGTSVLLALAGCAQPQPTSDAPPAGDSPSAVADDVPPQSALPLGCADVLSQDDEQAAFSVPQSVWIDETTTPIGIDLMEYKVAGGLQCQWGGQDGTDGVPDIGMTLLISPDAEQEFTDHATGFLYPDGDKLITDTLGTGSVLDCGSGEFTGLHCTADILVGTYWINAQLSDADGQEYQSEVSKATALLGKVVDAVTGAGAPRALWAPPAGVFDGESLCEDGDVASQALQADADTLSVDPTAARDDPGSIIGSRIGNADCIWSAGDRTVRIATLPGAEWAFDALMASGHGAGSPNPDDGAVLDADGVDGMIVGCGDGCDIVFQYTGSAPTGSAIFITNLDGPLSSTESVGRAIAGILGAG